MPTRLAPFLIFLTAIVFLTGCVKENITTPRLLKTENATQPQLVAEVNRFARVTSMRAKMKLKFEDNSFGEIGVAELYKAAEGEVVVQRPASIFLKIQAPIIKTDITQMTSNGEKFSIAVLQDGGDGSLKRFIRGTNTADYTPLQEQVQKTDIKGGEQVKKKLNAFSNLRPQHFTDALLVRPVDPENYVYLMSTTLQEEIDLEAYKKKTPTAWVLHGYYQFDEYQRVASGEMKIKRRFWFDRVGGIRLARLQIFDASGEIETDITYGREGNISTNADYRSLPLEILVTRPKDKYKMRLTHTAPETASVGRSYDPEVFLLKNDWALEELDLDQKLADVLKKRTAPAANADSNQLR